jgi:hypothetical protein
MPLTEFQTNILRLLAGNRQPESHLAGGTAINRSSTSPRYSADIDLFHDVAENVRVSAEKDAALLLHHGYEIDWLDRQPHMQRAVVKGAGEVLKLKWSHDSAFRFFPVQADAEFGYCLHPADLATNKALALAARSEIRDFFDMVYLHKSYLNLGAICWAACGKDEGFTPRSLLDFGKRHMKFREEDMAGVDLTSPVSLIDLKESWLKAVEAAEALIARLPLAEVGCLYLDSSFSPVSPDPASPNFASLIRHYGSVRGAWPVIS